MSLVTAEQGVGMTNERVDPRVRTLLGARPRVKSSATHPGAWYLSISDGGRFAWGPVWYDDAELQSSNPLLDPDLDRARPYLTFEDAHEALQRFFDQKR